DSLVALIPQGQKPVRNLTRQYVLQRFGPAKSSEGDFDPHQEWRELRPLLLRQRIAQALSRSRAAK
nr:hypothetical protein [Promineifilum sp.]